MFERVALVMGIIVLLVQLFGGFRFMLNEWRNWRNKGKWLAVLALCVMPNISMATQREVGSGQTHTTIQDCLNTVVAGDICNVHTGTYTEQLTLPISGTLANRITVQRNGNDVLTVQHSTSPVININGKSYWTFDGIRATYTGSEDALRIILNNHGAPVDYITITNGYFTVTGGGGNYSGIAILLQDSDHATISNNTVEIAAYSLANAGVNGITAAFASNLVVSGNTVFGAASETTGRGMDLILVDGTDITIEDNIVHDGWSFDSHPDCIVLQGSQDRNGNAPRNIRIVRNTVWNCTAGIYMYTIDNNIVGTNLIANNVIWETSDYRYSGANKMNGIIVDGDNSTLPTNQTIAVTVANNTVDTRQLSFYALRLKSGSAVSAKNNIFQGAVASSLTFVIPADGDASVLTLDYNYYDANPSTQIISWDGTLYTLAAYQSAISQETNGRAGSVGLNSDHTENSTSDSRSHGVNLSSLFITDRINTLRNNWDMGAYEFVENAGPYVISRVLRFMEWAASCIAIHGIWHYRKHLIVATIVSLSWICGMTQIGVSMSQHATKIVAAKAVMVLVNSTRKS